MKIITMVFIYFITVLVFNGCVSSQIKEQEKKRDELSSRSGFYCDFINGESVAAVDLELNIKMAEKCDKDAPFTITNYRQPNEQRGLLYCCILKDNKSKLSQKRKVYLRKMRTKRKSLRTSSPQPPSVKNIPEDANTSGQVKNNDVKNNEVKERDNDDENAMDEGKDEGLNKDNP